MGLELGLSQEDLDTCAKMHSQSELQSVEMLLLWLNKQHRVDYTNKYKLVRVLKELGTFEAFSSANLYAGGDLLPMKLMGEVKMPQWGKAMINKIREEGKQIFYCYVFIRFQHN